MHLLSRPRRPRRPGDWTSAQAVTFIVTLAATRSVTLAARAAGMSRKSAYALRQRDPAFAFAWAAASRAGAGPAPSLSRGNKVEEVEGPPIPLSYGNASPSRIEREQMFVRLIAEIRDSDPLAPQAPAQ